MLPVTAGPAETARQIWLYTILLVVMSLMLWAVAGMGLVYLAVAIVGGGIFLLRAWRLRWQQPMERQQQPQQQPSPSPQPQQVPQHQHCVDELLQQPASPGILPPWGLERLPLQSLLPSLPHSWALLHQAYPLLL